MKIATWNVNSIKARLPRVLEWLGEFAPDVALLQEIKSMEETFPALEIGDADYRAPRKMPLRDQGGIAAVLRPHDFRPSLFVERLI